jgi:hypothetical protein
MIYGLGPDSCQFRVELIGFGLFLFFIAHYSPLLAFLLSFLLGLLTAKSAVTACILQPTRWKLWATLPVLLIPLSFYDIFVSGELILYTVAGFFVLWIYGAIGVWFYRNFIAD